MKIITIANQKGGVGKTTLSVHLAHFAAELGKRVLIVDIDGQSNTTSCFVSLCEPQDLVASMLFHGKIADEKLPTVHSERISIIRADKRLNDIEHAPLDVIPFPAKNLRKLDYDLVIIDPPPGLGNRLLGALVASDFVVSPSKLDRFSLSGIADLLDTINTARAKFRNIKLEFMGFIPNMVNTRSQSNKKALMALQKQLGGKVFTQHLTERIAVADAMGRAEPVWKNVNGESHRAAAKEMREVCETIYGRIFK